MLQRRKKQVVSVSRQKEAMTPVEVYVYACIQENAVQAKEMLVDDPYCA